MFRRTDNLVVSQIEHSRLSGQLASLIGSAVGLENRRLFGAIALHDWPHFVGLHIADTIEIGVKTDDQQQQLLERLREEMPLDTFTELIVRMHWRRLSDSGQIATEDGISAARIEPLMEACGLTWSAAMRLDGWTDFCDALSFYLSRGESAEGYVSLEHPGHEAVAWHLDWETGPCALRIAGVPKPFSGAVSLLAYDAEGYPDVLTPVMLEIACAFAV